MSKGTFNLVPVLGGAGLVLKIKKKGTMVHISRGLWKMVRLKVGGGKKESYAKIQISPRTRPRTRGISFQIYYTHEISGGKPHRVLSMIENE